MNAAAGRDLSLRPAVRSAIVAELLKVPSSGISKATVACPLLDNEQVDHRQMSKTASNKRHKQRATRLVFQDAEPGALIAPVQAHLRKAPKARLLLSGGEAGDRYFFACRLANELGAPLAEIPASTFIGETEKNLRRRVADARERAAILLFDEADALLTKRGAALSPRTLAGRNAGYLLQTARRYQAPVFLSTPASGPSLEALENLAGLVVEFGRGPDQADRTVGDKPVASQNFRVFVDGWLYDWYKLGLQGDIISLYSSLWVAQ
jgi:hypothetical protein